MTRLPLFTLSELLSKTYTSKTHESSESQNEQRARGRCFFRDRDSLVHLGGNRRTSRYSHPHPDAKTHGDSYCHPFPENDTPSGHQPHTLQRVVPEHYRTPI